MSYWNVRGYIQWYPLEIYTELLNFTPQFIQALEKKTINSYSNIRIYSLPSENAAHFMWGFLYILAMLDKLHTLAFFLLSPKFRQKLPLPPKSMSQLCDIFVVRKSQHFQHLFLMFSYIHHSNFPKIEEVELETTITYIKFIQHFYDISCMNEERNDCLLASATNGSHRKEVKVQI